MMRSNAMKHLLVLRFDRFHRRAKTHKGLTEFHGKLFHEFLRWFQKPNTIDLPAARGAVTAATPFIQWSVLLPQWFQLASLEVPLRGNPKTKVVSTTTSDNVPAEIKPLCPLVFLSQFVKKRCPL